MEVYLKASYYETPIWMLKMKKEQKLEITYLLKKKKLKLSQSDNNHH